MKKIICTAVLSTALLAGFAPQSFASEVSSVDSTGNEFVTVSTSFSDPTSGGMSATAASTVGKATLEGSNPIGLKPYVYASTESVKGKIVYQLSAQAQSNNNGTGLTKSNKALQNKTNKVKTTKLKATTEKTIFTGIHTLKEKSSSATAKKTTTLSKWK